MNTLGVIIDYGNNKCTMKTAAGETREIPLCKMAGSGLLMMCISDLDAMLADGVRAQCVDWCLLSSLYS